MKKLGALLVLVLLSASLVNVESVASSEVVTNPLDFSSANLFDTDSSSSCLIKNDQSISCWGANYSGALGDGTHTSRSNPRKVVGINNATSLSIDNQTACAVLATGKVNCWGQNWAGQLGDGSSIWFPNDQGYSNSAEPVEVKNLSGAVSVAVGAASACAVLITGKVKCWGDNEYGELGLGFTSDQELASEVSGLSNIVSVVVGYYWACALDQSGSVKCWGRNINWWENPDEVGVLTTVPTQVEGLNNSIMISGGGFLACALNKEGKALCWGANDQGQLGNGTYENSQTPIEVSIESPINAIDADWNNACALISDLTIKCWGDNLAKNLGNNVAEKSPLPLSVENVSGAMGLIVGGVVNCAILISTKITCWGGENFEFGVSGKDAINELYVPTISPLPDSVEVPNETLINFDLNLVDPLNPQTGLSSPFKSKEVSKFQLKVKTPSNWNSNCNKNAVSTSVVSSSKPATLQFCATGSGTLFFNSRGLGLKRNLSVIVVDGKAHFATGSSLIISGSRKFGSRLTAKLLNFFPAPSETKFQWYRDGVRIKSAKSKTFTTRKTDKGHVISASILATATGYEPLLITSKEMKIK